MEWEAAPWQRWTNKRGQQDRPKHSAAKSSEEGEQETPGMQRNMAQAGGTLWHHEHAAEPTDQGHNQEVIWFINPVPKRKTRKSKVCLGRRCPELLP